jgi:hypothetical protein
VTTSQVGPTYTRVSTVTWRDTGNQVLALSTGTRPRTVLSLTGPSATIWRILDHPLTLADIRGRLGIASDPAAISAALGDLVEAGLLSAGRGW